MVKNEDCDKKEKSLAYQIFENGNKVDTKNLAGQKVILCLHGWGGGLASFEGTSKVLSKKFTLVCVDFQSIEGERVLHLSDYKIAIEKLLINLSIDKFEIIAHSFGARVAFLIASDKKYISRIEKLLLVGAAGIKPRFSAVTSVKVFKYKVYKFLYKKKLITIEKLKNFGSSDYKKLNSIMRQTFNNIVRHDCLPHIKKVLAKTLIVQGKKDTVTPLYMAEKIHKNIKGSELYIFNDFGHFCYIENSVEFNLVAEMFFSL